MENIEKELVVDESVSQNNWITDMPETDRQSEVEIEFSDGSKMLAYINNAKNPGFVQTSPPGKTRFVSFNEVARWRHVTTKYK